MKRIIFLLATLAVCSALRCPDNSYCEEPGTCCMYASGRYGCCGYFHGKCCSEGLYCCPEDMECALERHVCEYKTSNNSLDMSTHDTAAKTVMEAKKQLEPTVIETNFAMSIIRKDVHITGPGDCPDGYHCNANTTCCPMVSGGYGCCVYTNGVCCQDKIHCCPKDYTCDIDQRSCKHVSKYEFAASAFVIPNVAAKKANDPVKCPDGNECYPNSTCCQMPRGNYGCCPYSSGVCCVDRMHCCPSATHCDIEEDRCIPNIGDSSRVITTTALYSFVAETQEEIASNRCKDGTQCPGESTCCKSFEGGYGCCPYKTATCCSDGKHCCPEHTKCDLNRAKCIPKIVSNLEMLPLAFHPPSFPMHNILNSDIPAAEKKVGEQCASNSCGSSYTCCSTKFGTEGCCPFFDATCCDDGHSCCPHSSTCGEKGTCIWRPHIHLLKRLVTKRHHLV